MTIDDFKTILCESADEAFRSMKFAYGVDRNNPVEVWARTSDILDAVIRRRLRESLKEAGRDPYTGRLKV